MRSLIIASLLESPIACRMAAAAIRRVASKLTADTDQAQAAIRDHVLQHPAAKPIQAIAASSVTNIEAIFTFTLEAIAQREAELQAEIQGLAYELHQLAEDEAEADLMAEIDELMQRPEGDT